MRLVIIVQLLVQYCLHIIITFTTASVEWDINFDRMRHEQGSEDLDSLVVCFCYQTYLKYVILILFYYYGIF